MSRVLPRSDLAGSGPELSRTDLDAFLGRLYPRAVGGDPDNEVLDAYCAFLAARLGMTLVLVGRSGPAGLVSTVAQSAQQALWVELQHVPERCDEGLTGQGAAGSALRSGHPVLIAAGDPRLLVWRAALERDKVVQVLAWPFRVGDRPHVLELMSGTPLPDSVTAREDLAAAVEALAELMEQLETLRRQRLLASALESAGNAAFLTDLEGTIVWCNPAFLNLSGYSRSEVIGNNPRLLKSGEQGLRYYRELWSTIRAGRVWSGETVDRDREGRRYTIQQTVSPVASHGRIDHYLSLHSDISRQKSQRESLELASRLDPVSGLLTRACFDSAVEEALRAVPGRTAATLAILSVARMRDGFESMNDDTAEVMQAGLGERIRALLPPTALACAARPGEYLLMLPAGQDPREETRMLKALVDALHEPLPLPMPTIGQDVKTAVAHYPADGTTLTALRLCAERQLACEPQRHARRSV
ncbi:MAG TPA: PAS domain S-box protein, partial [Solimonas sp.]|nr:PAS domain S-box protein [Solimonas sp.]